MQKNRYHRQILVKQFGEHAQEILSTKHVVLIGAGGLGSHSADLLVRMGIGSICIIDHDVVEMTNLHRTSQFTEDDVGKPKAVVLPEKLRTVNSEVTITGIREEIMKQNIESLVRGADVLLDGTDSLPLRFLINDLSLKRTIPWVYAGVCETIGMVMGIVPKRTACLHCISREIPKKTTGDTPVLGSLPAIIAAMQCNETLKLLLDKPLAGLLIYDVWDQCFETLNIQRNPDCPVCGKSKVKHH